ncbi:RNA polymerase recycling motor HelD [Lutispora thermophila]|uniref:DNA helicase-2 / ATP-dependent DNA helicase PcrA n=1 Tax=Lutispora thermophila DSM 19022 TaxID=1122184 RepID=A0A1M6D9K4_9FIRM|nr:RNA polymerase recycling motor HelD [Lutispora thermophila]SHI69668.1 DNA helicase-2 / ATP-dependent DNA helicase PcrA [Lutispora thermophila DSM 19022]
MAAKDHQEYELEKERLEFTLKHVYKSLESFIRRKDVIDEAVAKGKKHFNSESSQQYIDLMINTMLQDRAEVKLKNLTQAKNKPYFACVEFKEEGRHNKEKYYIGKMALIDEDTMELIITDWRAPIANLYYESRLGEAQYSCPEGIIKGDLILKRQFIINEGRLDDILDIDITTNDEILQASLGANADNRLKDIVTTIQAEQNRIIRADMWTPLIVQGAAGSGKTTIALHRIAYLIYNYEKAFKPENFMIIAPNRLFLNYISEVLPELGVEKALQTTFEEFALKLIGLKLKIADGHEKINTFVNESEESHHIKRNHLMMEESKLKCSMLFKELIDDYIAKVGESYIPCEDFKLNQITVFRYEELNDIFLKEYINLPIVKRLDELKKHMSNRLKAKKEAIIEELEETCINQINTIKNTMEESEERQNLIINIIDNKNELVGKIEAYSKKAVNEYIKRISKLNPFEYYKDFLQNHITSLDLSDKGISGEVIDFMVHRSFEIFKKGYVEIEDLAPIIYMKYKIYGIDEKIPVKHIVIDEAQDFSPFQILVIRKIIKDSSFTILGDLAQGIHSYRGTIDWEEIKEKVFEGKHCELLVLEQSYRTTVEIMNAANSVLDNLKAKNFPVAKPVIRHGKPVAIGRRDNLLDICKQIQKDMDELTVENYKSMAIICKTLDECRDVYSFFKGSKYKPKLITGNEKEYDSNIVILPSYLSKGLEFDVVFIADCNDENYGDNEMDIKLLYVAMTRPLHRLNIYYSGKMSPLLQGCKGQASII